MAPPQIRLRFEPTLDCERDRSVGMSLIAAAVVCAVAVASGCSGCGDPVFDRVERWLRHEPGRAGKVGTLRGLEVAHRAREVARRRRSLGEGPCEIGWDIEEPFSVRYELEIDVEHRLRDRRWTERGRWQRDGAGRWLLETNIGFEDGPELQGQRTVRLYADEEGMWEWLGPETVARHPPDGGAQRHWRREFGGRFASLVGLVSDRWRVDGERRLVVGGGDSPVCGPLATVEGVDPWGSMLQARAGLVSAEITGPDPTGVDGAERCRRLRANYRLGDRGEMEIRFLECAEEPPDELQRPRADRTVDVERSGSRADVADLLQQWIDDELVDSER